MTKRDRYLRFQEALRAHDLTRAAISYDYESDELVVRFDGSTRPGVGLLMSGGWLLRVDRETDEPIGFQVEGFLAHTAPEYPQALSLLDVAELIGISVEELARQRRSIVEAHRAEAMRGVMASLPLEAFAAD